MFQSWKRGSIAKATHFAEACISSTREIARQRKIPLRAKNSASVENGLYFVNLELKMFPVTMRDYQLSSTLIHI
jgi:hypothetical protein